nr:peroxisomal biogenesis factor 3 [Quercus suber]
MATQQKTSSNDIPEKVQGAANGILASIHGYAHETASQGQVLLDRSFPPEQRDALTCDLFVDFPGDESLAYRSPARILPLLRDRRDALFPHRRSLARLGWGGALHSAGCWHGSLHPTPNNPLHDDLRMYLVPLGHDRLLHSELGKRWTSDFPQQRSKCRSSRSVLDAAMIAATRRWFKRNRTNLFVGAGVIGAGYLAGQYVLGKIQEARQRMSEERNQEDCTYTVLALLPTVRDEIIGALPVEQITEQLQQERQERLRRIGASEAATSELPSVPPSVADDDNKSLSSSSFVHASQIDASTADAPSLRPKKSKAQLWQEMKINSVTRALTMIYTLSLLTILTRIQLNLLGRRTYLSSVVALATPPPAATASTISLENKDDDNYENFYGNDFETNRKYLTFSWWLLHRGSRQIMERVMAAVKEVFGAVNIREDLTLERLGDLIMQVRRKVEGQNEIERHQFRWLTYLLPSREDEAFVIRQSGMSEDEESPSLGSGAEEDPMASSRSIDPEIINSSLRRLLDETSDLIDSPTFTQVLTRLLDSGYSRLVDHHIAVEAFKASEPAAPGTEFQPRVVEINENKCKLAHVLPVFCKQAHTIAAGSGELDVMASVAAQAGLGNDYLAAMDRVPDLGAFAAVIYSSNFEYEVAEGEASHPAHNSSQSSTRFSTPQTRPLDLEEDPEPSADEQPMQVLHSLPPQPIVEENPAAITPALNENKTFSTPTERVQTSTAVPEPTPSVTESQHTQRTETPDASAAQGAASVIDLDPSEPSDSMMLVESAESTDLHEGSSGLLSGPQAQNVADSILGESAVDIPGLQPMPLTAPAPPQQQEQEQEQEQHEQVQSSSETGFESAWQKALATEDGQSEESKTA